MRTESDQEKREGRKKPIRNKLAAAAATCALLGAAGTLLLSPTSASASQPGQSSAALGTALRGDLSRYLTSRRTAEPVSYTHLDVYKRQGKQREAVVEPFGQRGQGESSEARSC